MEIDDDQEISKLNGQVISNALATLNNYASEREISKFISNCTGHPLNIVTREVKEILQFAVCNGFLVKKQNKFSLPDQNSIYNLDCDRSADAAAGSDSDDGPVEPDSSTDSEGL